MPDLTAVHVLLRWLKDGPQGAIPIGLEPPSRGSLQAVTWEDAGDLLALDRLSRWHAAPAAGLRRWLQQVVLPCPDRLLFWVLDAQGRFLGHVGLPGSVYLRRRG